MKRSLLYSATGILLLVSLLSTAKAQQTTNTAVADTTTTKLAADLSVTGEKAARIKNALSYHSEELQKLIANTTMKPKDKQALIKKLSEERRKKIDLEMTPAQKAAYVQHQGGQVQRSAAMQAKVKQEHETEQQQSKAVKQAGN